MLSEIQCWSFRSLNPLEKVPWRCSHNYSPPPLHPPRSLKQICIPFYQDDDRIVSHNALCFMLYYRCARDISCSVFFSTHEMNTAVLDVVSKHVSVQQFLLLREYRVSLYQEPYCLYSMCFKGEFQCHFEGFCTCFTDLSRTTCALKVWVLLDKRDLE